MRQLGSTSHLLSSRTLWLHTRCRWSQRPQPNVPCSSSSLESCAVRSSLTWAWSNSAHCSSRFVRQIRVLCLMLRNKRMVLVSSVSVGTVNLASCHSISPLSRTFRSVPTRSSTLSQGRMRSAPGATSRHQTESHQIKLLSGRDIDKHWQLSKFAPDLIHHFKMTWSLNREDCDCR